MKHALAAGLAGLAGLAVAAGCAAGTAHAEERFAYVAGDTKQNFFLDVDTLQPAPTEGANDVSFWDVIVLSHDDDGKGGKDGFRGHAAYVMSRKTMDCAARRVRLSAMYVFDAQGRVLQGNANLAFAWEPEIPDSIGDGERKLICDAGYRAQQTLITASTLDLLKIVRGAVGDVESQNAPTTPTSPHKPAHD